MNENVVVAVEGSTVTSPSMEATSTIQETIDIHQAAEEAIFDTLPDVMNENVVVAVESSTVTSPSMEASSSIQETIDIHQATEEAIFDPLPGVMNENVAVVIEDSTVTSPSMEASSSNSKSNFVTFQSLVTLSMIPKNWIWSFDQIKQMIYCISMDQLQNGNLNIKSVWFQNKQEVMYYVNGTIIPSTTTALLSNHFTTIEDISQLIKDFNDRKICSGIPQERFRNFNFSSRLSATLDKAGVLRSKYCRTI
jgi:hypothetical protein